MRPVVTQRRQEGATAVAHRTAQVDGLSVFYREAGDPARILKLLLLGGFPASSHQFRNLIPILADRFHVLSPDYPGFGNSDMPDDLRVHLRSALGDRRGRAQADGFPPLRALHAGLRRADRQSASSVGHPNWLELQVIQNSNAYEEGFTALWDGIRPRFGSTEAPRPRRRSVSFLEPEGVKFLYLHGHSDPERISPDNWKHGPPLSRASRCAQGPARPPVRLPHQCRAVSGVAGLPPRAHAEDADPVGGERHHLRARGRSGVPARPPGGRVADVGQRALRPSRTRSRRSPRTSSGSTPSRS